MAPGALAGEVSVTRLFLKEQHVFHLPSFLNARNYPAFVAPEGNVFLIDVPVAGLQLLYEFAFGYGLAA